MPVKSARPLALWLIKVPPLLKVNGPVSVNGFDGNVTVPDTVSPLQVRFWARVIPVLPELAMVTALPEPILVASKPVLAFVLPAYLMLAPLVYNGANEKLPPFMTKFAAAPKVKVSEAARLMAPALRLQVPATLLVQLNCTLPFTVRLLKAVVLPVKVTPAPFTITVPVEQVNTPLLAKGVAAPKVMVRGVPSEAIRVPLLVRLPIIWS